MKAIGDNCLGLGDYDPINYLNLDYNNPRYIASPSNLLQELNHHFNNNNKMNIRHFWTLPPEDMSLLRRHNYHCLAGKATTKVGSELCVPRPRWCPTNEQLHILESIYEAGTVTPSRKLIAEIVNQLRQFGSVGEANVFYWFQNRKARAKRKATNSFNKLQSCNQNSKEVDEAPERRRRASEPVNVSIDPSAALTNEQILIANDRPSTWSSSSCSNGMSLITEPVISPHNYIRSSLQEQYDPQVSSLHLPYPEIEDEIKMYSYSLSHLPQTYFQDAYDTDDQVLLKGNILDGESIDYDKQFPASPTYITNASNSSSSIAQAVDDEFQLWDDMFAIALSIP